MNKHIYSLMVAALLGCPVFSHAEETKTVKSPDGKVELTVTYNDDYSLSYTIKKGSRKMIDTSALGLKYTSGPINTFTQGVEWMENSYDETYRLPHGKVSTVKNNYNELTVVANEKQLKGLTVRFRVYDDGVAFRYELKNKRGTVITDDLSEINIATFQKCWSLNYGHEYGGFFDPRTWSELTNENGYCAPMLIQGLANEHILLTEANNMGQMAASRIRPGEKSKQLYFDIEGESVIPSDSFCTQWRAFIMGKTTEIVESTLIQNLCEPTALEGWEEWVKPGICSWDWGAEDGNRYGNVTLDRCKKYIDFAKFMGWPYFLLDEGWDGRVNLADVTAYAAQAGVKILLWSNQRRFDDTDYDKNYKILKEWADLGIAGVKIDFFTGDELVMQKKYQVLLQAAADCKLMVNFHGCNLPTGTERTWPHLMTTEAAYGGEMYKDWGHLCPVSHGANLALTRNVLGPMDYTPVRFGKMDGCATVNTSWAYQSALPVLYESGFLTTCDTPSNFLGRESTPLLRDVPCTWDEIRCLKAVPGTSSKLDNNDPAEVIIARRSGDDWWIAGVSPKSRTHSVKLDFLIPGEKYYAYIYHQGVHVTDIAFEKKEVTSEETLYLNMKNQDGWVMRISKSNDIAYPYTIRREAEDYVKGVGVANDNTWCSQGKKAQLMNNATTQSILFDDIDAQYAGEYTLTFFYTNENASKAYVQVNDENALLHSFNKAGGESSHDPLGFTTIRVNLKEGRNTIKIYSAGGSDTPAFDRIMLMKEVKDAPAESAVVEMAADVLTPEISVEGNKIIINPIESGVMTLYAIDGKEILRDTVNSGRNEYDVPPFTGVAVVNVHSGSFSFSKKIIL